MAQMPQSSSSPGAATSSGGGSQAPTRLPPVYIEMQELVGGIDHVSSVMKVISASEAFRKFNFLTSKPGLNAVGDLRGMVVSARWRTVFNVSSKVGSVAGNIATVASLVSNIYDARGKIEAIVNSKDPPEVKQAKLSLEVSSLCFRTAGSSLTGGAHILATSIQGYLMLAGVAIGPEHVQGAINKVNALDTKFKTGFDAVTDPDNMYTFINLHLVLD